MQRYSKNRQGIIGCLSKTKSHPTAEWVYAQLKPDFPKLSLATVYRNLAQLKEDGLVRSIGTVGGQERFDGDITPHTHIICIKCGRVADLTDTPNSSELTEAAAAATDYTVLSCDIRFYGVCPDCAEDRES